LNIIIPQQYAGLQCPSKSRSVGGCVSFVIKSAMDTGLKSRIKVINFVAVAKINKRDNIDFDAQIIKHVITSPSLCFLKQLVFCN